MHDDDLRPHERALLPAAPERVLTRLSHTAWDTDEAIQPALLALCARYLTTIRDGRALDPVANFHLANGAIDPADQLARRPEPHRAATVRPG